MLVPQASHLTADVVRVVLVKVVRRLVDNAVEIARRAVRAGRRKTSGCGCPWRGTPIRHLVASTVAVDSRSPRARMLLTFIIVLWWLPTQSSSARGEQLDYIASPLAVVRSTRIQRWYMRGKHAQSTRMHCSHQTGGRHSSPSFPAKPLSKRGSPRTERDASGVQRVKRHEGNQRR